MDKYIGTKGILKLLDGEDNRRWEFHNVLYYKDQNIEKWFDGITRGSFAEKVPEGRRTKVRDFERISEFSDEKNQRTKIGRSKVSR